MHPYRDPPDPATRDCPEDRIIYGLAAVLGLVRVAIGFARGEWAGTELTIAAILVVFGIWGLVRMR